MSLFTGLMKPGNYTFLLAPVVCIFFPAKMQISVVYFSAYVLIYLLFFLFFAQRFFISLFFKFYVVV